MKLLVLFFGLLISIETEIISLEICQGTKSEWPVFDNKLTNYNLQDPHWAKVQLNCSSSGKYILKGGKNYLTDMTYFDSNRNRLGHGNSVELVLSPGLHDVYVYYPFLDPKEEDGVAISILPADVFYQQSVVDRMVLTGFLVVVLFLFFLGIAFYLAGRRTEVIYLEYALYLFSVFCFFGYQSGFLGERIEWVSQLHPLIVWISSAFITITYVAFIQSFLHLKQEDPLVYRVLNYGIGFVIFIVVSESIAFYFEYDLQHAVWFSAFSLILQLASMLFCLYRIYRMQTMLSRIALLGASVLVATTLFGQLASSLKLVDQTNYFVMGALILEIFIFNIGIGIRMVLMNKEKAKAQYALIEQMRINQRIQQGQQEQLELAVKNRTEELAERNEQNEMLLAEIHHRVKNNLQTISSLLSIQQRKLTDETGRQVIADSKSRVIAMGLIHEHLYKNAAYAEIDFSNYLEELVRNLANTYTTSGEAIALDIHLPSLKLGVENAILLGLIVNELVNNSIKHAFAGVDHPVLHIKARKEREDSILCIGDNGVSQVGDLSMSDSFGWKIINSLSKKLRARLEVSKSEGLHVELHMVTTFIGFKWE